MSENTYVGGKIIEYIKGNSTIYAKGDIITTSKIKVIQTAKEGVFFGDAQPHPDVEDPICIGNTIVELRPLVKHEEKENQHENPTQVRYGGKTYRVFEGEFGFDWYQQHGDIPGDFKVEEALITGEKNAVKKGAYSHGEYGTTKDYEYEIEAYQSRGEALEAFRKQYKRIKLTRNYTTNQYYVPYLALFSKSTHDKEIEKKGHIEGFVPPPYRAALRMLIDVEKEKPEKLEIKANPYFSINGKPAGESVSINFADLDIKWGEVFNTVLELECVEAFSESQKLEIYAYYKGTPIPQLTGRILVLPNTPEFIHTLTPVLVNTEMNVRNMPKDRQKGKFSAKNIRELEYLYAALCLYDWEEAVLDLTRHPEFKLATRRFIKQNNNELYLDNAPSSRKGDTYFAKDIARTLVKALDNVTEADGNKPYKSYVQEERVLIFFSGLNVENITEKGAYYGGTNAIIINQNGINNRTISNVLAHEIWHALGVSHTFLEVMQMSLDGERQETPTRLYYRNKKFVFEKYATNNIVDYGDNQYASYLWQWQLVNPKLKI